MRSRTVACSSMRRSTMVWGSGKGITSHVPVAGVADAGMPGSTTPTTEELRFDHCGPHLPRAGARPQDRFGMDAGARFIFFHDLSDRGVHAFADVGEDRDRS